MLRALLELLITVLVVIVARAVLTSIMRGLANASVSAFRPGNSQAARNQSAQSSPPAANGGDLHKDPVCGTYVAESTPFRQQIYGQVFYYCSDACREKHAMAVR